MIKKLSFFNLAIFFQLVFSNLIFSQSDHENETSNFTFNIGYGDQAIKMLGIDLDVDYKYEVHFFQLFYSKPIYSSGTWEIEMNLSLELGLTKYKKKNDDFSDARGGEVGFGNGFTLSKSFFEKYFVVYVILSTGPHYSSETPERQTPGFMFNSFALLGFNLRLTKNIYFDLRNGLRHLSNASLKSPNGGVNTWMVSGGIKFIL